MSTYSGRRKPDARHRSSLFLSALAIALVGLCVNVLALSVAADDLSWQPLDNCTPADLDAEQFDAQPSSSDTPFAKHACGDLFDIAFATADCLLAPPLMSVHALVVCDAGREPLLPEHFLPNGEIGPPLGNTELRARPLLLSHLAVFANRKTSTASFDRRNTQ
jgi:hypothetical protein